MAQPWQDPDTLRELYVEKRLTQPEIAERLGCGDSTISNWLERHDIKLPWKDESTMRRLYEDERMSQSEIADHLDCDVQTVERWMPRHGIEGRANSESVRLARLPEKAHAILTDKQRLAELYVGEKMPASEIAETLDVARSTANLYLKRHGLSRSLGEALSIAQLPPDARETLESKDRMRELYVGEELSLPAIAERLDCGWNTVANYLESHGIERRSIADALGSGPDHHSWEGGQENRLDRYAPNWSEQREARLERDDYECVVCGRDNNEYKQTHGRGLDVHHITPLRRFVTDGELDYERANELTNLITLCRACHARWEGVGLKPQT
jgi:transposase